MSDSEDPLDVADEGDDLFGDGDDAEVSDDERPLSDHELDEEDRNQRGDSVAASMNSDAIGASQNDDSGGRSRLVQDRQIFRHKTPKPSDGVLRSLKVPDFFKLVPEEYEQDSYEPDAWDLFEDKKKYPAHAIRWRKNEETGKMESNAVVYRWSDGSLTIAVGKEHFEIEARKMAPPIKQYNEKQDANYYAAAAHLSSNSLITVGHITEEFKVRPSKTLEDAAVNRLMDKMDAANKHRNSDVDVIFRATEDPEQMRKQAEQLEKDRERARRRKESQAARADGSFNGYGRSGGRSMAERDSGERGASGSGNGKGGSRSKGAGSRQKRRRPEYDSDDDLPQGARRQDDYDMGDDFIAASDEEVSEVEDEDDEEELLDDDEEDDAPPRSKRQKTAESADADGEPDGPSAPAGGRKARRHHHVVDDEDD